MAFDHLHQNPQVDVVTAANNIKKLLHLALTTSQGLSMFVHPVGKTLLIDNFDIHKWLLNPQPQWKWLRDFFYAQVLGKDSDLNKAVMIKSHTNDALVERNWMSKFLYYSLLHDSRLENTNQSLVYNTEKPKNENEVENVAGKNLFPQLPEAVERLKLEGSGSNRGVLDDRDV